MTWKRYTRWLLGLFLVLFGASMIWGETYPGQGYLIGGVAIAAAVFILVDK